MQRPEAAERPMEGKPGGHAAQTEHLVVRRGSGERGDFSGPWAMARPLNFLLNQPGNPGKVLNWGGTCSD